MTDSDSDSDTPFDSSMIDDLLNRTIEGSLKKPNYNKFVLFMNEKGESMHFVLDMPNDNKRAEYKALIKGHCGVVHINLDDCGPYSIVLVLEKTLRRHYDGECFRATYINNCIEAGRVLNINNFQRFQTPKFTNDIDFMKIVYYHEFTWDTVPAIYLKKNQAVNNLFDNEVTNTDLGKVKLNKSTRLTYSEKERRAIVQYIVTNEMYDRIKGRSMWIEMETDQVCPIRTWQSMKEHFLKNISGKILSSKYLFLDVKAINKFRNALKK